MPYGILYIADVFRRNGFDTKLVINTFKKSYGAETFIDIAKKYKPDIIGLSFSTLNLLYVYNLIKQLKDETDAIIICGGPHPSSRPNEVINKKVDIVVKGEGELTLNEICTILKKYHKKLLNNEKRREALVKELKHVKGISFLDLNKNIVHNQSRKRNTCLDELPLPDFDLVEKECFASIDGTFKGFNKIENGRGCPNNCTFCDRSVFGNRYITKSPKRLLSDIEYLIENQGIKDFYFTDDTFTINQNYVLNICDKIIRKKLAITWTCCARVDTVTEKMLNRMKDSGCRRIIFGVESGDNDWLRRTKKGITTNQAIKAVDLAFDAGIETHVNLMCGYPWETPEHIENQIRFIKLMKDKINMFQTYGALIPYPNTGVFEEYKDKFDLDEWWLKEKYQNCGQVIYQNAENPYKLSTFFQRNLYDDTYIYEDYFFKFSNEYKKKIRDLLFLIGRHNLKAQYRSQAKQKFIYYTGVLSRLLYELNQNVEKKLVSKIRLKNSLHDFRKIGEFIKR